MFVKACNIFEKEIYYVMANFLAGKFVDDVIALAGVIAVYVRVVFRSKPRSSGRRNPLVMLYMLNRCTTVDFESNAFARGVVGLVTEQFQFDARSSVRIWFRIRSNQTAVLLGKEERFRMNNTLKALIAAGTMALAITSAGAQVTVASVGNRPGDTNNYYAYRQNGGNGSFFTTPDNGATNNTVPVLFTFNIPVPAFTNPIQASMFFGVTNNGGCTTTAGKTTQALNGGTITVVVSPTDPLYGNSGSISHHGNEIIFQATFASSGLSQDTNAGNPNPSFGFADPSDNVVFSSTYFTSASPRTGTLTFSSGGNLSCTGTGGLGLNSGVYGGGGNFAASTASGGVPEPGVVTMLLGTGVAASMVLMRRRRRN